MATDGKKNDTIGRKKTFFIPLFSTFQDTLKARVFRNNAMLLRIYLL